MLAGIHQVTLVYLQKSGSASTVLMDVVREWESQQMSDPSSPKDTVLQMYVNLKPQHCMSTYYSDLVVKLVIFLRGFVEESSPINGILRNSAVKLCIWVTTQGYCVQIQ